MKLTTAALTAAALSALLAAPLAHAEPRRARQAHYDSARPPHYSPGQRVRRLPEGHVRVVVGGAPFFYYGGTFYRRVRPDYLVISAPIGAHVGTLPPGYVSFGIGSRSFFYVNATYYLWEPRTRDYVVVEEPEGAAAAMTAAQKEQTASPAAIFAYPNQGQSEEQARRDRYECHLWAADQSGYDPTYSDPPAELADDYRRAMTACLVGRGYTVR